MSSKIGQIKIVFFADSHLGFDYPIRPRLERRRRGYDFFDNYKLILNRAKSTKTDLLIHGGDMFYKSRVHDKIVDLAYEPLLAVAEAGIPIFIVPGNHERSELPNLLLLSHPNIFVFDKPKTFALKLNKTDLTLSGFPFKRGDIRSDFKNVLADTDYDQYKADIKLLCMHQAVEGAVVGPANYTFRYGKDTIKVTDFPLEFDAVLAGHIHRHQILTRQSTANKKDLPIIYPGSIERTAFSEKNEDKGFVELFCSKSGINKIDFVKLPARPMIDLDIDRADSVSNLKASISTAISGFDNNAIVRINCDSKLNENVKQQLNTTFFRSVFPDTMNFQFGIGFYRPNEQRIGTRKALQNNLIAKIRKEVPDKIGIYMFYGREKNVIYVGKSVNLKQRMLSYFYQNSGQLENRMRQMIFNIHDFSFMEARTELLALILEDYLIKKHLPDYNIKQQEFDEYRYLLLTNDRFPTLKIVGYADIQNGDGHVFGPFKDQYFIRDLLNIIYPHLNLRQCQDKEPVQKSMNYDFGYCTGPCRGKINEDDYSYIVQSVIAFLSGDERHLVENLSREMKKYSAALAYEKAAKIKKQIQFCHNFCKRQRFIHRFKTSKLVVHENGNLDACYTFSNGQLASAQIDKKRIINPRIDLDFPETNDDRYLLDRANIVHKWLNSSKGCSYYWS